MWRRHGFGRYMYIRIAFLIVLLVAVLVLHASGKTLVVIRVARYALVGLLVVGGGLLARRRGRESIGRGPSGPGSAGGPGSPRESEAERDSRS
jgi:hypothetical protein